ncbi:hypothetical protein [Caldimonas tepidiphila]|uniref:hypothetical protein n=1 Tax=Caldimonas tepidiphila TaxID=2315841 RepID=UPI0013005A39|nr:hypothetical protein [Caldimonas tepidiphila]
MPLPWRPLRFESPPCIQENIRPFGTPILEDRANRLPETSSRTFSRRKLTLLRPVELREIRTDPMQDSFFRSALFDAISFGAASFRFAPASCKQKCCPHQGFAAQGFTSRPKERPQTRKRA